MLACRASAKMILLLEVRLLRQVVRNLPMRLTASDGIRASGSSGRYFLEHQLQDVFVKIRASFIQLNKIRPIFRDSLDVPLIAKKVHNYCKNELFINT